MLKRLLENNDPDYNKYGVWYSVGLSLDVQTAKPVKNH